MTLIQTGAEHWAVSAGLGARSRAQGVLETCWRLPERPLWRGEQEAGRGGVWPLCGKLVSPVLPRPWLAGSGAEAGAPLKQSRGTQPLS